MTPLRYLLLPALLLMASHSWAATVLGYRIVGSLPRDPALFTQGLLLEGHSLYESGGLYGRSSLHYRNLSNSRAVAIALPGEWFAEGIAMTPQGLWLVTWREGLASLRDPHTLEEIKRVGYPGEGWGLAFDGQQLILSDGSDTLRFYSPHSFQLLAKRRVTLNGRPLRRLNELEWVDGQLYANIFEDSRIVRIDPGSGAVTGVLNLGPLARHHRNNGVLNGIAWHAAKQELWVTGKNWPALYRLKLVDPR